MSDKVAIASERVVVLMTPQEKAAVAERAQAAGHSVGGYIRQAVREFDPQIERELAEIQPLIETLEESNAQAWAALSAAEKALDQTIKQLRTGH